LPHQNNCIKYKRFLYGNHIIHSWFHEMRRYIIMFKFYSVIVIVCLFVRLLSLYVCSFACSSFLVVKSSRVVKMPAPSRTIWLYLRFKPIFDISRLSIRAQRSHRSRLPKNTGQMRLKGLNPSGFTGIEVTSSWFREPRPIYKRASTSP